MNNSLILTVNLLGEVSGFIEHTTLQPHSVAIMIKDHEITITKEILHTDREPSPCVRRLVIPGSTIDDFVSDACPAWEKSRDWKKFSNAKRIYSHLSRYDEGYGYSVEELEDGDIE